MSRLAGPLTVAPVLLALLVPAAPAQDGDIYYKAPSRFDQDDLKELLKSDLGELTEAQKTKAATVVRYLVYRLTDKQRHGTPGDMAGVVKEGEIWIGNVYHSSTKNLPFREEFRKQMLAELKRITEPRKQHAITKVNAARVLARLAGTTGDEEVVDHLVAVVSDKNQVDGARYWAFRGLRDLFALRHERAAADDGTGPAVKNVAAMKKAAEAVAQFIERPLPVKADAPAEEKNGLRMVRREAIRALAEMREPKAGKAALVLTRLVAQDKGLALVPRLDERIEAAIGIGLLRPDADFQPGYALPHVARMLVEFLRGAQSKSNREPWKVHAARLEEAFRHMARPDAYGKDAAVQAFAKVVLPMMVDLSEKELVPNPRPLQDFAGMPPAAASVYKSDPKSTVEARPAGDE